MGCCSPENTTAEVGACPECGATGQSVMVRTIKNWLVTSHVTGVPALPFYFCKRGDCPIVYFSEDGSIQYTKDEIRYPVGSRESKGSATICYCFGVTEELIAEEVRKTGQSTYSSWIAKEVKQGNCACDVRNPSGKCCLKEVKKVEEMYICKEERK